MKPSEILSSRNIPIADIPVHTSRADGGIVTRTLCIQNFISMPMVGLQLQRSVRIPQFYCFIRATGKAVFSIT